MSNFLTDFPEMPNKQFREFKKGVDASYKDFIESFVYLVFGQMVPIVPKH